MIYIARICGAEVFLNMTDEMSDKEIDELANELAILKVNTDFVGTPHYFKQMGDKYEIKVICPFCKEESNYKNFKIDPRVYTEPALCRNCAYRFRIYAPTQVINQHLDLT